MQQNQPMDPRQALMISRIIWAALLAGQVVFAAVVAFLSPLGEEGGGNMLGPAVWIVEGMALLVLATGLPLTLMIRRSILASAGEQGPQAAAGAYASGTIMVLGSIEGASLISLVGALLGGGLVPYAAPALLAFAVFGWMWPTGKEMEKTGAAAPSVAAEQER